MSAGFETSVGNAQANRWRPQFSLSTLFVFIALVAVMLGGWRAVVLWGKSDFCRGWAEHYAEEAERLRKQASIRGISAQEVAELRLAADRNDIAANKYAKVAERPWLPYPRFPLFAPDDEESNPTGR
jgi:hypothetical protein